MRGTFLLLKRHTGKEASLAIGNLAAFVQYDVRRKAEICHSCFFVAAVLTEVVESKQLFPVFGKISKSQIFLRCLQ